MEKRKKTILRLCESAIMIALATVLSMIKFANLPFGGSVTLCSMLPLVLIAYRYKWKWGVLTGVVYGLVQMVLGANNLSYGTSALAVILIILFDYLVAFGVIGFAGVFRDKFHNQPLEIALGAFVGCALRYICHFISGWAVWKMWAPEGQPAWLYSVTYNATYMVPETIVTIVVGVLIALVLDFRKDTVGALKRA